VSIVQEKTYFEDPDIPIYQTKMINIGLFRCHPEHPLFEDSGPIQGNLLVFPRTSVAIQHAGSEPIVASPNIVMFYNRGQVYRRYRISERGDHCEWFGYESQVMMDALRPFDRDIEAHAEKPFGLTHGLSDPTCYLLQRKVVEHLLNEEHPDELFVEETMLRVLERTVERAFRKVDQNRDERAGQSECVRAVQAALATRFQEPLSLGKLAGEFGYSPYYLCRIFRQHSQMTIHQYLTQVRLRTALEWMADGVSNLTEVALRLGFSSHSHFTMAFRKAFGAPPSQIGEIFPHSNHN
jgi:AraC family transcriptional regulator